MIPNAWRCIIVGMPGISLYNAVEAHSCIDIVAKFTCKQLAKTLGSKRPAFDWLIVPLYSWLSVTSHILRPYCIPRLLLLLGKGLGTTLLSHNWVRWYILSSVRSTQWRPSFHQTSQKQPLGLVARVAGISLICKTRVYIKSVRLCFG